MECGGDASGEAEGDVRGVKVRSEQPVARGMDPWRR